MILNEFFDVESVCAEIAIVANSLFLITIFNCINRGQFRSIVVHLLELFELIAYLLIVIAWFFINRQEV